jgi:hypothetical protein
MGRSPGFASIAPDMRPLKTRFRCGSPPEGVNRAGHDNSPDHYAKGTRSGGPEGHRPPTARRHGVSGSVSSPGRGSSHRSVALLGSLSVVVESLALREGPRGFRPGFTCPTLLGYRLGPLALGLRGCHPLRRPFPGGFGSRPQIPCRRPHDPDGCPHRFRLVPVRSPLLGESRLLSVPPGTEMFQFPGSGQAFRDRRSFGSSPGHFAAFHACTPDDA